MQETQRQRVPAWIICTTSLKDCCCDIGEHQELVTVSVKLAAQAQKLWRFGWVGPYLEPVLPCKIHAYKTLNGYSSCSGPEECAPTPEASPMGLHTDSTSHHCLYSTKAAYYTRLTKSADLTAPLRRDLIFIFAIQHSDERLEEKDPFQLTVCLWVLSADSSGDNPDLRRVVRVLGYRCNCP